MIRQEPSGFCPNTLLLPISQRDKYACILKKTA